MESIVLIVLFCSAFIFLAHGEENCDQFITDSTVNNLKFPNPQQTYYNLTVNECTKLCMQQRSNRTCLSYGYQALTNECFIYDQFASLGDDSEPSEGMVLFWVYSNPCPTEKNYTFVENGKFCAKFYYDRMNWSDAQDVCRQDGGHLMIVNKEEKIQFLVDHYNKDEEKHFVSVGATDVQQEGYWKWFDGSDMTFWKDGEPNDWNPPELTDDMVKYGEDCAEIRHDVENDFNNTLNDTACTEANQFACEIPQY